MYVRNSSDRYAVVPMALHWFMLLLIGAVYFCTELREAFPKGSTAREALKTGHYVLGLSVLLLTHLRLLAYITGPAPRIEPDPPRWQKLLARFMHVGLYAFMVAMPLAGWLLLSAKGQPIPFFAWELPPLTVPNKALAKQVDELHEVGGTVGYALIGAHATAALFHHYVVRDNTLLRMLPDRFNKN